MKKRLLFISRWIILILFYFFIAFLYIGFFWFIFIYWLITGKDILYYIMSSTDKYFTNEKLKIPT